MPRSAIPRLLLLGLLTSALAPAPALADSDVDVYSRFKVDYELDVSFEHHQRWAPATIDDALSFHFSGALPEIDFYFARPIGTSNALVDWTVDGKMSTVLANPEGTSNSCSGGKVHVAGLVGIAPVRVGSDAFWFAPWLGGRATGTCRDSDGKTSEGQLTVSPLTPPGPADSAVPPGAVGFHPDFATLDTGSWSAPFDIRVEGKDCPDYVAGHTTSCSIRYQGTLRLTRVSREERKSDDDLLAPVEAPPAPPKADPPPAPKAPPAPSKPGRWKAPRAPKLDWSVPRPKASTRVSCPSACRATLAVGVESRSKGRTRVTPLRQRSATLRANAATTISVPLSVAVRQRARQAARRGKLVATLTVRIGGKREVERYRLR